MTTSSFIINLFPGRKLISKELVKIGSVKEYFNKIVGDETEIGVYDTTHYAGDFAFEWDFDGSERKRHLDNQPQYIKDGFNYFIVHREKTSEIKKCENPIDLGKLNLWGMKSNKNL